MSSNTYAAALRLELKPSRQRRYWRWLTHLTVAATLPMLQSLWLSSAVAAGVLLSLYRSPTESNITLLWHSDGRWSFFKEGVEVAATLAEAAFIQPWLVILPLRVDTQRRIQRIAIFPDMLPAQDFRRLRVRLRSRHEAPDTVDSPD
jgi:hypothetical protein